MTEYATDMLGQTYTVGDFVVYATTSGRSPVQKFARVEKIITTKATRYHWDYSTTPATRTEEEYAHFKVGVREISNGRGFVRWDALLAIRDENDRFVRYDIDLSKVRTTYPMSDNIVKVVPPSD